MPESTPIGKTDRALTSSVAGAIIVSAGPNGAPVFDANNYWDAANRQRKLIGQAAGAGGDRHNLQTSAGVDLVKVDANGTMVHNMGSGGIPETTTHIRRLISPDPLMLVTLNECLQASVNPGTPPNALTDVVWSFGPNNNGNGAQVVSGWPSFTIGMEYHWWNGSQEQAEFHFPAFHNDELNIHIRPLSGQIGWLDGNCSMSMCTHNFAITSDDSDPDDQTPYVRVTWDIDDAATGLAVRNKEGDADAFVFDSTAQTDALVLGRGTNDTSILTLNGKTATVTKHGGLETWRESVLPATAGHYWYVNEFNNAILEGGTLKGWLTLVSPTGQGNGATLRFLSNGANVSGLAQLDNSGNFVLRTAAAGGGMFLDSGTSITLRTANGSTIAANFAATASTVAGSLAIGGGTAVKKVLSAAATLDFGSVAAGTSADLTISVTGAAVGDPVSLGLPASPDANTAITAWVSAADTVKVRFNNYSSAAVDPASGSYRASVFKF